MATWTLHASISIFMAIAMTVQSTNHLAPQVVYQRLEHALITDSEVRYLMQQACHRQSELVKSHSLSLS